MASTDVHWKMDPSNGIGAVRTEDQTLRIRSTVAEANTVELEEETMACDTHGDHSTVSTEWSHNNLGSSSHPSSSLEAKTDPTSISSGILDDLELDRKCTESPLQTDEAMYGSDPALRQYTPSPMHSIEATYGSDSVHSGYSTSSSDSKEDVPVAVNPGKVEAIGDHFGNSGTEASGPRFVDPKNSWEAELIKERIKKAHATMDDIDLHPEEHFRDQGSSYQVSARPIESPKLALDAERDIAHPRTIKFAPESFVNFDTEEGHYIERPKKRCSSCCVIV